MPSHQVIGRGLGGRARRRRRAAGLTVPPVLSPHWAAKGELRLSCLYYHHAAARS
jgi:hypothetical protein